MDGMKNTRSVEKKLQIEIPEALGYLFEPARYKVAYGGRGSGKSWGIARALLVRALSEKTRVLCAREVQKSIRDSVHRLLSDQIDLLGLGSSFAVLQNEIRGRNGSQFLFSGLANTTVESIKSFEGCNLCWVEEAQTVSDRSWEILIPTIRAAGSEIWVSFNPDQSTDPTYQRFVVNPPPGALVRKINWDANEWFPAELEAERDYLYRIDPEAAAHVWGGECRRVTDAQVLRGRYCVESFEARPDLWDGPYQGIDFGFATDPSVLVRCWVFERRLYVEHEAYGLGVEIDHLPALFDAIPEARRHLSRADNSRPETISYLVRAGYNAAPCRKWAGSVEDGVEHLRSYEQIVIHPRCSHTAEEARLWSYKTDRLTGQVQPVLLDLHNHCMDALRYALEPVMLGRVKKEIRKPDPAPIPTISRWR